MAKPTDNQSVKDHRSKKPPDAKALSKQKQQDQNSSVAKRGERPIADVDRKVRGGDA